MDIRNRKETVSSLEYHTLLANFGFVNGKWYYIYQRKPIYAINITVIDDPKSEQTYRTWLDEYCRPLSEDF